MVYNTWVIVASGKMPQTSRLVAITTPYYGLGSLRRKQMFLNILAVTVVVVFFAGLVYWQVLVPRRKARLADQLANEALNAEMDRVGSLPKLNTRWLMRVPDKLMDKNPICCSYGTRYNRMLIIDENGLGWVGLVIPEILEDLTAGEYVWRDYHIPFRGAGEAYAGKSVNVYDVYIDIYPIWMTEGVNTPDWSLWAEIECNFRDLSKNWNYWNYQSGLGE